LQKDTRFRVLLKNAVGLYYIAYFINNDTFMFSSFHL
jgi:hypothetical protein